MSQIIGEHIQKSYGALDVLLNISFRLGETERVGLVGPNGEGKSTLLRIIAGDLSITDGAIHRAKGLRIGYLPQDPPTPRDVTVYGLLEAVFDEVRAMETRLAEMGEHLVEHHDDAAYLEEYGALQNEYEVRGGYDYPKRIERVLDGLKFPREMWERPLSQLSGGERTRAALAALLLEDPDILLLDEPTNHLDLDTVEWLEGHLSQYKKAIVVVSHDRWFLDRVTNATWEVAAGGIECYRGSYKDYLPKRHERLEQRRREYQAQQEYIAKEQEFINRHIAGQRTKEAQGRRTRLQRMIRDERRHAPPLDDLIHLRLPQPQRSGEKVLDLADIRAGYSEPLVAAENLGVQRQQRIAIVGANGIGKTTLLRTILGELPALGGEIHWGTKVKTGYLSQTHAELDPEKTILENTLAAGTLDSTENDARNILGSLQIRGDDAYKVPTELSGGQRSRVILSRLCMQRANCLLLDEPTNHLDIPSTEILQEALSEFDGTVLMVSHDRYLVAAVATDVWVVTGELGEDGKSNVKVIPGNWDAYLAWRDRQKDVAEQAVVEAGGKSKADRKAEYLANKQAANRLAKLRRDHEKLELAISEYELQLEGLNNFITAAGESGDLDEITRLGEEYAKIKAELDDAWAQWETVGLELEG
ncbi:MAG: ABC-F family ATP-binding cassette domain-containing protein [Phycisphaerales bacterium]|jgi:ATP-binding cassette, subfamily F, member 3|nr:ABC-F family ATP-binding cassette domain-containing protein [Phycisphaerales bacterium]MBT7171518.1 ABC-F family ATP-binding cassette domain-containing protein [Phycisphaerales bacterium]